jgi:hypothetical protein
MIKHRTSVAVLAAVAAYSPALASTMKVDRNWVWYCGPSLMDNPTARLKLQEFGFRFAKKAHAFADGTTDDRARWFHPCGGFVARPKHSHRGRCKVASATEQLAAFLNE